MLLNVKQIAAVGLLEISGRLFLLSRLFSSCHRHQAAPVAVPPPGWRLKDVPAPATPTTTLRRPVREKPAEWRASPCDTPAARRHGDALATWEKDLKGLTFCMAPLSTPGLWNTRFQEWKKLQQEVDRPPPQKQTNTWLGREARRCRRL